MACSRINAPFLERFCERYHQVLRQHWLQIVLQHQIVHRHGPELDSRKSAQSAGGSAPLIAQGITFVYRELCLHFLHIHIYNEVHL